MNEPAARPAALCPHCAIAMREVSARARSGYLMVLDQCPRCGGVWCDRWELFPLAPEEAERIDRVDDALLQAPTVAPTAPGRCPRCTAALQPFHDPMLPPDVRIERCRVCDGMWMNRGELARMKRRSPPTHALPADALARLASAYGTASSWSKVDNLDAATYRSDPADADDQSEAGALLWSTAPWIVLRALLRLLLRI
jgi:Zn-finger nucleic acid-binding protein